MFKNESPIHLSLTHRLRPNSTSCELAKSVVGLSGGGRAKGYYGDATRPFSRMAHSLESPANGWSLASMV